MKAIDVQIDRSGSLSAALERLETAVAAIHDSEAFRRYLDVQARFHHYSYGNVLLILAQDPEATQVAGYRAWQALDRQVRRGERGIKILVPMKIRARKDGTASGDPDTPAVVSGDLASASDPASGPDCDPASVRRRLLFGIGTVFDVRQTEGKPLPAIDVPVLMDAAGADLYRRLEVVARDDGLAVERDSRLFTRPETMGFYSPAERLIAVREAAQLQMTKTLAHELAHHYGNHQLSDAQSETIAESVAYVTLAHHGLDSGVRSFPYVATWSREPAVLRAALGEIQSISSRLINLTHA